ncbi:hypothetical protein O181_085560 [Austropuccinia psidii MF-1]|uniref:Tf2-1-like SH3-like domain-containing protein n=1 Tax=Austropuccinia psidii MF-1 TaxID=1389203 RepID=A0A9Q3IMY8_9BASI|nr:hypothetical protein [Austropuccinia psidii MF-1]
MWKRACYTAAKFIAEAKEYNKQRWDKTHMEPDFKEGDQVLVSTLSFDNLKGPKKMRDSFVGPLTIINLIGKNAVEVKLTEECSRKHPVFPVSLVKPYLQTEEQSHTTRYSGSGVFPLTFRFKSQTTDKDKWLAEDAITDGNLHLRIFRASRRTEQSHQL